MCPGPFSVWNQRMYAWTCVCCGCITLTIQGFYSQPPRVPQVWALNRETDEVIRDIQGWRGVVFA